MTSKPIEDWDQLLKASLKYYRSKSGRRDGFIRRWVFRGQSGDFPFPRTSLERCVLSHHDTLKKAALIEANLLREFQRRAHHYLQHLPHKEDTLTWLALIRHFGAPARILDCSYSFFVAAYFALERPNDSEVYKIWAFDANWCARQSQDNLEIEDITYDHLRQDGTREGFSRFNSAMGFVEPGSDNRSVKSFVFPANPFQLNERLTVQQGVFLCPGDVTISLKENLDELGSAGDAIQELTIKLNKRKRRAILQHLYRMTIDRASLFPDLQGFAESLNTKVALNWISRVPGTIDF